MTTSKSKNKPKRQVVVVIRTLPVWTCDYSRVWTIKVNSDPDEDGTSEVLLDMDCYSWRQKTNKGDLLVIQPVGHTACKRHPLWTIVNNVET